MSSVGGIRIHQAELHVPAYGDWKLDAILEGGTPPAAGSKTSVVFGDLTLAGVVKRSDTDAPDRPHVVTEGAPGWAQLIKAPLSFQSDAGVKLSSVLKALAGAAGQAIELPPEATIGTHYECLASRTEEPRRFRDALAELARMGVVTRWRVDPDGVTRFGPRAGGEVTARAITLRKNAGVGVTVLGLDAPSAFLPGSATLNGSTIDRVVFRETSAKLHADVYTNEPAAVASLRDLIRRMIADELGRAFRTYIVATVHGDKRLDLVPPPDASHLPELANVEQWTLGGVLQTPQVGAQVLVIFRDADPTRPVVVAWDASSVPDGTDLGGGGPAVTRVGDIAGRLYLDTASATLYYSPSTNGNPSAYSPVVSGATPPLTATPGSEVSLVTGSPKVTSG